MRSREKQASAPADGAGSASFEKADGHLRQVRAADARRQPAFAVCGRQQLGAEAIEEVADARIGDRLAADDGSCDAP